MLYITTIGCFTTELLQLFPIKRKSGRRKRKSLKVEKEKENPQI
jgi:hypothetical protein